MRARRFPPYPKAAHSSGQARIKVDGKDIYLGVFDSAESWTAYRCQLALWQAGPVAAPSSSHSISELVAAFILHVEEEIGAKQLSDYALRDYQAATVALLRLFSSTSVGDFTPRHLEATGRALLTGSWLTEQEKAGRRHKGGKWQCSRKTANHRMRRIRTIFKWGARVEIVPWEVYHRLTTAAGFRSVGDRKEVQPVDPDLVQKTLPLLGPVTRAIVQVQLLTGMRSGEVCGLTVDEIDRNSLKVDGVPVWVYRPSKHKTAHLGSTSIAIGPQAQAALAPFVADAQPGQPLFSPLAEMQALAAARPHRRERKGFVKRRFLPGYTVSAYYKRIRAVCERAGLTHWHPHQLRHLAEVMVERAFDLDYARAVLRHRDPRMTVRYGIVDLKKAAEVAAKIG